MPRISVIIPVYNVESYIERCLTSVISQSFQDFECICVDDCGNDSSIDIVQRFVKNDSRFKVVSHEKNRGLSAARNTGLDYASGEFVICIDSDDWVDNTLFEFVVNAFEKHDVDSVWYNARMVHEKNNTFTTIFSSNIFEFEEGYLLITPKNINNFPDFAWNKVYRKEVLDKYKLRYCEGLFFEDSEFYIKTLTFV